MHDSERTCQPSEGLAVGALLALAGGLLDAYTYLTRGGVFANAETGNIVLLGLHLAQGHWRQAGSYLLPVLAFFTGILVAERIKDRGYSGRRYHWRHAALGLEMAVIVLAACVPPGERDGMVNVLVSFVCAVQVETFRKVRGNPFASTMCTGNLRSGTEALYRAVTGGDRALLGKCGCYFAVIGCFVAGAALGCWLCAAAGQWAALGAAAFQAAAFWLMRGQGSVEKA